MNSPAKLLVFAVPAWLAVVCAGIDSGGGLSAGGPFQNRSSIGASFATLSGQAGITFNHPGPIEIIYPVTPTSVTDVNTNGLPDGWEMRHFGALGLDPSGDGDHDGASNLLEYLAGTNPGDAGSVFRPQGIYNGGVFQLPIPTVSGRRYQIWVSRDLMTWTPHGTLFGDDTLQLFEFDETSITSGPLHSARHPSAYFFRIQILIP